MGSDVGSSSAFRTLADGLGFIEGPVWLDDETVLVASIDRGLLYSIGDDGVKVAADVGGGPNGATEGADGAIFVAQSGVAHIGVKSPGMTGGVQIVRPASSQVSWLTQDPICANDLCVGPDGFLYVTDPTWRPELDDGRIWRVDVESGEAELLGSVPWFPNGIGFGADDALYIASTAARTLLRVEIDGSRLGKMEVVLSMDRGMPDGFAFDTDGHVIIAANTSDDRPGSIQVWDLDGKEVEVLEPVSDSYVTNVALSGHKLVACASSSGSVLIWDDWPSEGLALHPFRTRAGG